LVKFGDEEAIASLFVEGDRFLVEMEMKGAITVDKVWE
jgi:hypothetical protein